MSQSSQSVIYAPCRFLKLGRPFELHHALVLGKLPV